MREDSGARDFVVSGDQLQNLTIVGRSAAELMRGAAQRRARLVRDGLVRGERRQLGAARLRL